MNEPRPLHEVFGERANQLAEDRHAALDEAGHPGLPDELLAEAVVSYADTAPAPVAEQLAPFVTAHTAERFGEPGGAGADLSHGLELLAAAPAATGTDLDDADLPAGPDPAGPGPAGPDPADLDFGGGAGPGDHPARQPEPPVEQPTVAGVSPPVGDPPEHDPLPALEEDTLFAPAPEQVRDEGDGTDGDAGAGI
jgi:hypothetical protein